MYEYRACPNRVVDGDTIDLLVDVGFYMTATLRFRVLGIDTPELRRGTAEQKVAGKAAKVRVEELMKEALEYSGPWPLRIRTEKADSFGRWLATIYIPKQVRGNDKVDGDRPLLKTYRVAGFKSLGDVLIAEGHAEVYRK